MGTDFLMCQISVLRSRQCLRIRGDDFLATHRLRIDERVAFPLTAGTPIFSRLQAAVGQIAYRWLSVVTWISA